MSDAALDLWARAAAVTCRARADGDLQPIETVCEYYEDAGVRFALRRVVGAPPKAPAGRGRGDPFLPYERALYVADLGADHVVLLNKYNVFANHLLIVTRHYEHQEAWLTPGDFQALWRCMGAFDAFGFYNGGRAAGASQRHKHLQVVPLPLSQAGPAVPISALISRHMPLPEGGVVPALPFSHRLAAVPRQWWESPMDGARAAFECYRSLLRTAGLCRGPDLAGGRQTAPYNLMVTPEWMMLVPRRRETFRGITINSLGLGGALLARDERQMAVLERDGPMAALRHVAVPRGGEPASQ